MMDEIEQSEVGPCELSEFAKRWILPRDEAQIVLSRSTEAQ